MRSVMDSESLDAKQYQHVLDSLPYGIVETCPDGKIQIYNQTFLEMCDSRGGIGGKYLWDVFNGQEAREIVHERFQMFVTDPGAARPWYLKPGLPSTASELKVTLRFRPGADGEMSYIVAMFEAVGKETKISDTADKLANVVRQSSESIVLTDLEGNIQYVNPMFERLTGYSFDEVQGKNPRVLSSKDNLYPPDYYKDLWQTIARGNTWKGEFHNKRKNGDEFIEEASIFPVRDPKSGEITGYGAVKADITRRRELERELKRSYEEVLYLKQQAESANKMKSFFLANMSHDIRTPLNGILGFADLLVKQDLDPKSRAFTQKIISSGQTLMSLLNDILDFSKIEAGQLDIQAETFELRRFVKDIEAMFELQFKEKKVDFQIRLAQDCDIAVHNDKWRLQQVLMNLLANALKFTREGSVSLDVSMEKTDLLLFQVSDTGPGIPSDYIQEVFKPFSQVKSNTMQQRKGTGLGLSICKNLVKLMGGSIAVESVLGQGSVFSVRIPANPNHEIAIGTSEHEEEFCDCGQLSRDLLPSTILIAEDNPVNKELLEEQLREYGFSALLFASDGKEAVELALEHQPALVLMDIQMPRMDGKEAIRQLRQQDFKQPILVMSAYAMQDDIDSALRAGADGYITKPVDFDRFFYEVRKLLRASPTTVANSSHDIPFCCLEKNKGRWLRFSPGVSSRLRAIFMKDARQKLEVLRRVESGEQLRELWDEVKTVAHGYKGSAAHFGLSCLEALARQLDEGMRDGLDEKVLMGYLRQLSYLLESILEENK